MKAILRWLLGMCHKCGGEIIEYSDRKSVCSGCNRVL